MRPIGFSTGAIAKQDFRGALDLLGPLNVPAVELSALRLPELEPLVQALPELDLTRYDFVSFHAPSRIQPVDEERVIRGLIQVTETGFPVVVHPDVMFTPEAWRPLGRFLFLENMDKRKSTARSARDFEKLFIEFPDARFCFDIAHARQVDPTMTEAYFILEVCGDRLAQVHISELNTDSHHEPISTYAIAAFQSVANLIPEPTPIILETLIDQGQSDILTEIDRARRALTPTAAAQPTFAD